MAAVVGGGARIADRPGRGHRGGRGLGEDFFFRRLARESAEEVMTAPTRMLSSVSGQPATMRARATADGPQPSGIRRITLPMNKLAITAQTKVACSEKRSGPGVSPFMIRAPIRMAMVGDPGSPRVKSGIIAAFA